jgi:hypothetical protein
MVTRKTDFYEQISDLYLWENTLSYDNKTRFVLQLKKWGTSRDETSPSFIYTCKNEETFSFDKIFPTKKEPNSP